MYQSYSLFNTFDCFVLCSMFSTASIHKDYMADDEDTANTRLCQENGGWQKTTDIRTGTKVIKNKPENETIKDECNYISAISPTVSSNGQWINGNNNTQSSIYGVNQDYLTIRQLKIADGEMFTDTDIKAAAKVCILGQTVVDYLFPDGSDPIGRVVRFNSIPFRVIGVLQKKGYNSMGMDQDDLVLAPYTTVMKRILAQTYLSEIVCSAITEEASEPAQDQISQILRRTHKLKDAMETTEGDKDDFNIRSFIAQIMPPYSISRYLVKCPSFSISSSLRILP